MYRTGRSRDEMKAKNPHAQALGTLGGRVKSAKKAAAARANGKRGGRPIESKPIVGRKNLK
jgi:hypothetical protein